MCTYCMIGDQAWKWNPPWPNQTPFPNSPFIPAPINPMQPINPWPIEQLKEYLELLKQVKELEDKLGCPCEPNKANYIELFEQRIKQIGK